jgi:tetratricopeptide (TPR) repeat protein
MAASNEAPKFPRIIAEPGTVISLTVSAIRRAIATAIATAAAAIFGCLLSPFAVHAQLPNSSDQIRDLMTHRQEVSKRAVDETSKRRFEEGKPDSPFPLDGVKLTKGGVLRALTPEEQKALQQNERGLEFFSKGKLDVAIKAYEEAIRLDPKLAAAHNNLGTAHFAAGRFEQAAASFQRACDLDPDFGQAFLNLALAQIKLGSQKDANESLDKAMHAYVATGEEHFKAGRFKEAEEAFRGMLQIDPDYAPALVRLGLVYNATGRYEEAAQSLRRVAEREPTNGPLYELLAEALYGQKKYDEAAASAEHAIRVASRSANAYYLAGLSRAAAGQRDAARAHLAKLRELQAADFAQKLADFIDKNAR